VELDLSLGPINVFFGPNGAGKSTLLDTVWFVRDCFLRSVDLASSERSHGIGLLSAGAPEGSSIVIGLATAQVKYHLTLRFTSGRIDPKAGEILFSTERDKLLIHREPGSSDAEFADPTADGLLQRVELREPEKVSLDRYLDLDSPDRGTLDLYSILLYVRSYHSRYFDLHRLRQFGSESGPETMLLPPGSNLWSVLRNLEAKRLLDERYETVIKYMKKAFPGSFDGFVIEQTGPNSVYASFLEKGRRQPILASGVSDGQIQLLALLTALFSEGPDRYSLLLMDEPETSLHPWAIAVLAEAMREAAKDWNKQIMLATHSPVLISQFDPDQLLSVETHEGRSTFTRLSDMTDIQDLLEQYAAGTLYMGELIAGQSQPEPASSAPEGPAR
jgi:predicted ATPase